jgi:hypothetical protein
MSIRLVDDVRLQIGDTGDTITAMTPQGKVNVGGRIYDARSDGCWIDANVRIVVVDGDHLGIVVRPIDADHMLRQVDQGQVTSQACWQKRTQLRADSTARRDFHWQRFWSGMRESTSLGAVYGLICVAFGFGEPEIGGWLGPWLWAVSSCLCGAIWGGLLFLVIHTLMRNIGEFEQLALVTLGLALLGSTGGTVAGYSVWGLIGGLVGAVLGAVCLGLLIPVAIAVAQAMAGPSEGE